MRTIKNIWNAISATVRFVLFWTWVLVYMLIALFSRGGSSGPKHLRFFMGFEMWLARIKVHAHGELSKKRPLLVVSNHISIFEFATFPIAFGGSFFGKKEIEKFPVVGWIAKKFGVIYIDRRPSAALGSIASVKETMAAATWPMFLFPEGTTTNGAYVKEFKSTLFNFMETADGLDQSITVQPVVMFYRHRDGSKISDEDMAEHYAYFDNIKQDMGPRCSKERNWLAQLWHAFYRGGFNVEIYCLPPPDLSGIKDRKELASMLHDIVSKKYMELK